MSSTIDIIQTFIGACDTNSELWDGYVKLKRAFELKHIQRLHMQFMHEAQKTNPDSSKLTTLMKRICVYAQIGFLPDDKRLDLFRLNELENNLQTKRKKLKEES